MSKSAAPARRNLLYPVMILSLVITALGLAAWTATASQALGLSEPAFTPTHSLSFALAEIAKPTYSTSPTATSLPTQTPTATPQPEVQAEIVLDRPASESLAPIGQDNTYAAQAPSTYGGNKYILIDISEQHMYVYEGDLLVFSFVSSTGMNNATRTGNFSVLNKIANAYGATWNIWMPNWLGIYWAGSLQNGIHALPILSNGGQLWAGYLGVPISYGCVVLGVYESQLLYDWSEIGTPVEIRW
ncbi:MAG: L,D-transpeptidase [Anaerolineales bacterium]|nr:L,D-transpeptidase [Anaerolineales bacterium]